VLDGGRHPGSLAQALAARLAPDPPDPALTRAVNAALVLLADHELAASTVAVRVAASTRSDVYDAVLAGMAVLGGPLHGSASRLAYGLLRHAVEHGPAHALNEALRWQHRLAGFGHSVYRGPDPRFGALRSVVADLVPGPGAAAGRVTDALAELVALAAEQGLPPPNVDLGLGALALAGAMPEDAGRVLVTVARVAGWVAHYLEELDERPLRYRARAVYAGPG